MTFSGMVGLELEQAFYLRILVVGRPFSFLVCVRPLVIGSESKKGEGVGVEGFGFIARKQLERTKLVATARRSSADKTKIATLKNSEA